MRWNPPFILRSSLGESKHRDDALQAATELANHGCRTLSIQTSRFIKLCFAMVCFHFTSHIYRQTQLQRGSPLALFRLVWYQSCNCAHCAAAGLLGRRGAHRTAVEVCRLLLSLDPAHDPLAALLCFDYYCLRSTAAGSTEPANLLLPFIAGFHAQPLLLLPSYAYSAALALHAEDAEMGKPVPEKMEVGLEGIAELVEVEPASLSYQCTNATTLADTTPLCCIKWSHAHHRHSCR